MVEDAGVERRRHLDMLEGLCVIGERLKSVRQVLERLGDGHVELKRLLELGSRIDDPNHIAIFIILKELDDIVVLRGPTGGALNVDRSLEHLIWSRRAVFKSNAQGRPRDRLHTDHALEGGPHGRHSHHGHFRVRLRRDHRLHRAPDQPLPLRPPLLRG